MVNLALVIEQGAGAGQSRVVAGAALRVGRSSDADWRVGADDPMVSRFHVVVRVEGAELIVEDTSSNGVFINDEAVPLGKGSTRRVGPGDRIRIGGQVLRVTGEAAPSAASDAGKGDLGGWFEAAPPTPAIAAPPEEAGGWFDSEWLDERGLEPPTHPLVPGRRRATAPKPQNLDHHPMPRLVEPQEAEPPTSQLDSPVATPSSSIVSPKTSPPRPAMPSPVPREPAEERLEASPAPSKEPREPSEERLVDAFLRGAGLDRRVLGEVGAEALFESAGARLRDLAHGLTQLLQARAEFKNAARVSRTQISSTGNNPLKLAISAEEAVLAVLVARDHAYLPPQDAVAAAVSDLQEHELRMLEAVQAALNSLLARFDPENFEAEMEKESLLTALVAGGRRGRCWDLFRERFASMSAEGRNRFLGEVGPAFADAYDADRPKASGRRRGGG